MREQNRLTKVRLDLIAEDQTGKLGGLLDELRQRAAGFTHFAWTSLMDGRGRPLHRVMHGNIYAWDALPDEGRPGDPIRRRCQAAAVINFTLPVTASG